MSDPKLPKVRPIGKWERLSHERQEREVASWKRGHPRGFVWDHDTGDRVVKIIEKYCKHHKGEWAGKPLILEEWQRQNVREIFGWKRADGLRRYRNAWDEEPRKNGKTEKAAGVAVHLLVSDGEPGAEVYATATKREQALILFSATQAMVRYSPELRKWVKPYRSNLSCERLGSKMEPLSADYNTLDGLNPHGDLRDEVHAWKDHGLSAVLDTAMGARRQPLTYEITTAGVYDKEGVGWQHHDNATKILDGVIEDDTTHVFIASADEGDDPFDPATWWKANPNLGVSVKLDYIAKQAKKAKDQPSFYNDFLRLHLNMWTQQITRWISPQAWEDSDGERDDTTLRNRDCWGGLDMAHKLDLTAFVLAFLNPDDTVDFLCRCWLPRRTLEERVRRGQRHWQQWADEGSLIVTPGDVIDHEFVRKEVNTLAESYHIQEIGFDPWGATALASQLGNDGFQMVEVRQGYRSMSEPSKDFEARVVARRARAGRHPVMRFCVSNAVVASDPAGNIKPDREAASDKIDLLVAGVMALSRLNVNATNTGSYITESGGLLVV